MDINNYKDLNKITMAELKVAIYNTEKEMQNCLKKKNVKGFLDAFKLKLKLNKLLGKKVTLVEKENDDPEKQL